MGQNFALNIVEKGFPISVYNPRDFVLSIVEANGRGRRTMRNEDAENTECMHRCRTSAISHTALRLSGWQSPPGLSLGPGLSLELAYAGAPSPAVRPFLLACPPSNQQHWSCSEGEIPRHEAYSWMLPILTS